MPVISRISATPYNIPLKAALTWGSGHELQRLEHVLIRVELSDGAVGFAEATPRPSIYGETQVSVLHVINEHLAPMLLGQAIDSFAAVSALSARAAIIKNNNTARGALDLALHQALANSRGERLTAYLGAERDCIRLSAIVSTGGPEAVMADVDRAYHAGIRVFKVKIGRHLPSEINTIAALIDAHPDAQFYVDANETLESSSGADILSRLRRMGVIHCEEALPVHLLRERRQLRRDCAMPIIADDSAFTARDLEREIAFDTFDILNIKTARTGYSESALMLELCQSAEKDVMVGSQASSLLGCLQAAIFAGRRAVNCASECSFFLNTDVDLSDAPPIEDGWLALDAAERSLASIQHGLMTRE
ncbi:MAG: enolase [Anaerolineae bacterium]|nr:enolase [Anaerolineae bacterium]